MAVNPFVVLSNKISCSLDEKRDKKICGRSIGRFIPTPYADSHGATGSQSVPYSGLEKMLDDYMPTAEDSFIDIGCGQGRVIAYLLDRNVPCKITGVELNPDVADVAKSWTSGYPNVKIIEGDAFKLDYNGYTALFMYRPMEPDTFLTFIEQLENTLTHAVRLFYYADGQSGYLLNERPGWDLSRREEIYKVNGRYIHREPQRFSVWTYTPD